MLDKLVFQRVLADEGFEIVVYELFPGQDLPTDIERVDRGLFALPVDTVDDLLREEVRDLEI